MLKALLTAAVAGALYAGLATTAAARAEGLELRAESLDLTGYPTVRVTVSVLEGSGRPVTGLGQKAFGAEAGGHELPVVAAANATNEGLGMGLVLAFDVSGSMAGASIQQAQEAGTGLMQQLGPGDEVALLSFAATASTVQAFTADREAASAAIGRLTAGGDTALHDGVAASVALASQSAQPRRAVVLLSDGVDTVSVADRRSSLEAARAAGIPFFVVALGQSVDRPYLDQLATASRGQLLVAPAQGAIAGLYSVIGAILRQQYVLTVKAAGLRPGSETSLIVSVQHEGATATSELPFKVPGAPPPARPPVEDAAPAPRPQAQPSGGGPPSPLLLLVPVVAGAALIAWRVRKRLTRVPASAEFRLSAAHAIAPPDQTPPPPKTNGAAAPPDASLQLATPEETRTYRLGPAPVTIGFTAECDIRLPAGAGEQRERVRVWRREGRFMAHALSPCRDISISGQRVSWAVLEEGDEIQMGACQLKFHVAPAPEPSPRGF